MQMPGTPSLILLAYVLLLIPWLAMRTAQKFAAAQKGEPAVELPSRAGIWIRSLVIQLLLLTFAWIVGSSFGFNPFAGFNEIRLRDVGFAVLALAEFSDRVVVLKAEAERVDDGVA